LARGAKKTAENTATAIGQSATAQQGTEQQQQQQSYNTLTPLINSYLQPGGNPAQTAATMGALGSSFGAAKQQAQDTATRTRNAASTDATIDSLARQQGAQAAQSAASNIADQQKQASGLLSSIYGMSTQDITNLLNSRTGANNSYIGGANIKPPITVGWSPQGGLSAGAQV
jgi:hypothetical protein